MKKMDILLSCIYYTLCKGFDISEIKINDLLYQKYVYYIFAATVFLHTKYLNNLFLLDMYLNSY